MKTPGNRLQHDRSSAADSANSAEVSSVVSMGRARHPGEPEADLVVRFRNGDMDAFDGIFDMYRTRLLAYATGMVRDRSLAEDVVQDCFVTLARKIDSIDAARGVSAWLYRVARNRCIDVLRHRKPDLQVGDDMSAHPGSVCDVDGNAPDRALAAKEQSAEVRRAVDALPAKERELLVLRFYSDLTFQEVARVVKRPLGTVLWQVRKTLMRLRDEMQ